MTSGDKARVTIEFGPDPDKGGLREIVHSESFYVCWLDQFGTRQMTAQDANRLREAMPDWVQVELSAEGTMTVPHDIPFGPEEL